ncbi:MAG: ORF6N domain-containing protein [Candidatus Dormibacter sp.]
MTSTTDRQLATLDIEGAILFVRGLRVMLDTDLAALYGVENRALLQAVRRNLGRFPEDFAFQLSAAEWAALRSQTVTSNAGRGGRRYAPWAFTEQGVAMLSSVLRSQRAAHVNVEIMRAFVRLRRLVAGNAELAARLDELEQRYDAQFKTVVDAIRQLMAPPPDEPRPRIGFKP